ncbi:MAG: Glycine/D-amino acid oxidase [Chitinophagaceae bacterium]|nr:Glycine/D-amino acid oxidase [Chitinophagaceae bacterium]
MQVSIWEKESFLADCDIMIAGSGLMGLWTAFELKQQKPSLDILIIDKHPIPQGASTRNAGFACFGSPSELIHDAGEMSEEAIWDIVEMRYRGIQKIRQYFKDDMIGYEPSGGYEVFASSDTYLPSVKEKLQWLNDKMKTITGVTESFSWADEKISLFGLAGFESMIENRLEGALHSGKLVMYLQSALAAKGVRFLYGTELKGWQQQASYVSIDTTFGSMHAQRLVIAANAFSASLHKNENIVPGRGQVIVTSPIPSLKLYGSFHYDEGYYYFRNVGNRILLGGARNMAFADEKTTSFETSEKVQSRLNEFLDDHIAGNYEYSIDYSWSGIMAFTDTGLPTIQKADENVFIATSCNGMGVAITPIFAEKLTQQVIA